MVVGFNTWQTRNCEAIEEKYRAKYGERAKVLASCWANKWYYGCSYPRPIHNIIDHWEPPSAPQFKNVDNEHVRRGKKPDKYTQVFDEEADGTVKNTDDSHLYSQAGTLGLRLRKTVGSEKRKKDVLTAPSRRLGEAPPPPRRRKPVAKPSGDDLGDDIDSLLNRVNSETSKNVRVTGTGETRTNRVVLLQEKAVEFSGDKDEPIIEMVSQIPKSKKRKLESPEGGPPSKVQISELELAKIFVKCHTKEIVKFKKNQTGIKPPDVATYLKSKGISQDTIKAHRGEFIKIVKKVCLELEGDSSITE